MRFFCGKNRGAISVFLTLILVPVLIFSGIIVDISRLYAAKTVISGAGDLTMNAALARYDKQLKDSYGLITMADDPSSPSMKTYLEQSFLESCNASALKDTKSTDLHSMIQLELGTEGVEVQGVKNSSLAENAAVSLWTKGDNACRMWKVESAGGKKIRLKNENSSFYLTYHKASNSLVQKKYSKKDNNQIFSLYQGSGGSTYLKCVGAKAFVCAEGNTLTLGTRKRNKKWRFVWEKIAKPTPAAFVSGATYPARLLVGHAFTLKGMIASRYSISLFSVSVFDKSGKVMLQKKWNGDSCFGTVSTADSAITFGKLTEGTYRYLVAIRDVTKTDIILINREFTVGALSGGSNMTLSYDAAKIAAVGYQSNGTALEKKACASYALAYCNAILTGTVTSPHSYWSSSTNVDCVWSKGGYTTKSYASEAAVLQAAYNELMAGKPSILHVTGNTPQHWITIIGCKKTGDGSGISVSDLVAIDPWDGKVITVSDKYKVKTSYRLGVKS